MKGRLDLASRCLGFAGALLLGGLGCARSVDVDTGGGGSGGSGGDGGGGATTATLTISTSASTSTTGGSCVSDDDCLDLNSQCTLGACVDGECVAQPGNQFGACDDGLFCTTCDSCQNGVCVRGPQLSCAGDDACTVGVCDEATNTCLIQPGNNGAQCDDGDPCTYFGSCQGGACNKGAKIDCSFLDSECSIGTCDPVQGCIVTPVNDGFPCDDGLFCTGGDSCQQGACTGGPPLDCAPPGGCFVSTCDEATDKCINVPGNDGAACEDGSPCTASTTCAAGVCSGGVPANDGAACDDSTSCTTGETCSAGLCAGGMGPTVYFSEDFKDNSKGWVLGPEWQIGPAMPSDGFTGNPDPAMDHTPTNDNGVAGVVIGGNASTNLHSYYWLESPPFDASAATGQVILGFYRHLNSDYDPYMHNRVEVYNGNQWITLWTSGPPPAVMDASWTFVQHNLTNYKNPQMRVRFGFDITQGGVYTIGSWSVDDVLVAAAPCP